MIGIIDYGMGNLRSVQKAFEAVRTRADILTQPEEALHVDRLVLPGVGAFADGMNHLHDRGWIPAIRDFIGTGKPFLGICLGMQLLFEGSQEDAPAENQPVPGLGLLPGQVVQFDVMRGGERLKVPHMGWNTLDWDRPDPLLAGIEKQSAVYFVHSYYVESQIEGHPFSGLSATCDYGGIFCASIWHKNIWATQFHPEKSQRIGLKLLANFAQL